MRRADFALSQTWYACAHDTGGKNYITKKRRLPLGIGLRGEVVDLHWACYCTLPRRQCRDGNLCGDVYDASSELWVSTKSNSVQDAAGTVGGTWTERNGSIDYR